MLCQGDLMDSVIIRSRNEERYIGHTIQSVTDYIGNPEIILVDNESTDNTIRIVNRFEYHNIKKLYINGDDYTPGRALNKGIVESNGEFIIILSALARRTSASFNELLVDIFPKLSLCFKIEFAI